MTFFADFASGLGKYQAEAFEDFAKGFEKVIGALTQMVDIMKQLGGGMGGMGTVEDLGAFIQRMAEMALFAAANIDAIINQIGGSRLKGLSKGAARIKDMIEAVIIDFSGMVMAEIPDIAAYFAQFALVFDLAVAELTRIKDTYGPELVAAAAAIVDDVLSVLKIMGANLQVEAPAEGFLDALTGYFAVLPAAFDQSIDFLKGVKAKIEAELLSELAGLGEDVVKAMGVLGIQLGMTTPEEGFGEMLTAYFAALPGAFDQSVAFLKDVRAKIGGELLTELAAIAQDVGAMMNVLGLGSMFDELTKQTELGENETRIPLVDAIETLIDNLFTATDLLKPALLTLRDRWAGILEWAVELTGLIGETIGNMAGIATSFQELGSAEIDLGAIKQNVNKIEQAQGETMPGQAGGSGQMTVVFQGFTISIPGFGEYAIGEITKQVSMSEGRLIVDHTQATAKAAVPS